MLYYGNVSEGEGIAGQSGIAVGTSAMRGSIGIVFLTRHFSYGGLYHCGASGILNPSVQATIRQMLNHISPGIVVITPPQTSGNQVDLNRVKDFLKLTWPAAEIGFASAAPAASLRWTNGKPELNRGTPDGAKTRSAPEAMRNAHLPSGRKLLGGVMYYGGRAAVKEIARSIAAE